MLGKKTTELLMKQINHELYSAYLYLKVADYYESESLSGFASWYIAQSKEEVEHAMLIRKYLIQNNINIALDDIETADAKFNDPSEPLYAAQKQEIVVTGQINDIIKTATEENDYRTIRFLQWFIDEQFEEEITAQENIDNYEMFAGCNGGLAKLNSRMGKRAQKA